MAKSDNTDCFRNIAATIGAIPLTCDAHGTGSLLLDSAFPTLTTRQQVDSGSSSVQRGHESEVLHHGKRSLRLALWLHDSLLGDFRFAA
jgi:hypothetical protein